MKHIQPFESPKKKKWPSCRGNATFALQLQHNVRVTCRKGLHICVANLTQNTTENKKNKPLLLMIKAYKSFPTLSVTVQAESQYFIRSNKTYPPLDFQKNVRKAVYIYEKINILVTKVM